LNEY